MTILIRSGEGEETNGTGTQGELAVDGTLTPADDEVTLLRLVRVREDGDATGGDEVKLVAHDVLHELRVHPRLQRLQVSSIVMASQSSVDKHLTSTSVTSRLPLAAKRDHALRVDEKRVRAASRDLGRTRDEVRAGKVGHDGRDECIVLRSKSKTPEPL